MDNTYESKRDEQLKLELELLKRKQRKNLLTAICVILVIAIVAVLVIYFKGFSKATNKYDEIVAQLKEENQQLADQLSDLTATYMLADKEISIDLIQSDIKAIGELATIEYLYTDAGKFEDPKKFFKKEIPLNITTKSFIAKWDGTIKAGIDINKVTVEINENDKKIIIGMPPAEILSHEVDSASFETLDTKNGLFNKVNVDDVRKFDDISKNAMEARAIENGILDKAFENAKGIIERLVNNKAVRELEYTVEFILIE